MKRITSARHHQAMRDWSRTMRDRALTGVVISGVMMVACLILPSV